MKVLAVLLGLWMLVFGILVMAFGKPEEGLCGFFFICGAIIYFRELSVMRSI